MTQIPKKSELKMGQKLILVMPSKLSDGSKKQFNDALNVFEIQYGKLDIKYMADWSKKLGIGSLLDKIQSDAELEE